MKYLLALCVAFLVGCSTPVAVERKFPEVPEELLKACPDLQKVPEGTKQLSEVIVIVNKNYSQYHQCRVEVDQWIDWYNKQKKIFESVK